MRNNGILVMNSMPGKKAFFASHMVPGTLAIWGLGIIFIIAASPQPILASDEFAYWALSFPDLFGIDPVKNDPFLQQPGSQAYRRIIVFLSTYFTDSVIALRMMQILLYASCAAFIAYAILKNTGSSWWWWGAALLLTSPFALYVPLVMPETWFFCIGGIAIVLVAQSADFRFAPLWAAAAGALAVQAIFFKPHALALIGGLGVSIVVIALFPNGKRLIRVGCNLSGYLGGCFLSVPLGFLLWDTTTLLGPAYQAIIDDGTEGVQLFEVIRHILAFSIAGALIAGPAIFLPILCGVSGGHLAALNSITCRAWVAAVATMGAAIVLAALFTVDVALNNSFEALRIHGRYFAFYGMIAGLASFAFLLTNLKEISSLTLRASLLIYAVTLLLFFIWVLPNFKIFPWDNPWMAAFIPPGYTHWPNGRPAFDTSWVVLVAMTIFVACGLALPRQVHLAHIACVLVVNVSGAVATLWFVNQTRDETRVLFSEVRAFSDLTASTSRPSDGIIVIHDRYGRGAFALWGLKKPARVVVLKPGSALTSEQIPAEAPWIIMVERYDVQIPYMYEIRGQRVRLLLRQGARPRVIEAPTP